MRFDSQKNPAAMQGDGSTKFEPAGVALQIVRGRLYLCSTNGRGAICIAAQAEPQDMPATDSPHCYAENIFGAARDRAQTDEASVHFRCATGEQPVAQLPGEDATHQPNGCAMPKIGHVVNLLPYSWWECSLDARMLMRLQHALNATFVTLRFPLNRDGTIDRTVPIHVKPTPLHDKAGDDGSFGILMPVCSGD